MTTSAQFAVPKDRQRVRVHLTVDLVADGTIFLEFTGRETAMHDRLIQHLENGDRFFPLAREDGRTEFICKENVRMIEVEYPDADEAAFSLKRILRITATFIDGAALDGELVVDAPKERSRLSDCLNMPSRFLSLRVDGKMYYINKEALRTVVSS